MAMHVIDPLKQYKIRVNKLLTSHNKEALHNAAKTEITYSNDELLLRCQKLEEHLAKQTIELTRVNAINETIANRLKQLETEKLREHNELQQRILELEQENAEFKKLLKSINQLTTPSK